MAALYADVLLSVLRFLPARDLLLVQSRVCRQWKQVAKTAALLENPGARTWKDACAPIWTVVDPAIIGRGHCVSFIRVNQHELRITSTASTQLGDVFERAFDTIVGEVRHAADPNRPHLVSFVTHSMQTRMLDRIANGTVLSFASPEVELAWNATPANDKASLLAMLDPWWNA